MRARIQRRSGLDEARALARPLQVAAIHTLREKLLRGRVENLICAVRDGGDQRELCAGLRFLPALPMGIEVLGLDRAMSIGADAQDRVSRRDRVPAQMNERDDQKACIGGLAHGPARSSRILSAAASPRLRRVPVARNKRPDGRAVWRDASGEFKPDSRRAEALVQSRRGVAMSGSRLPKLLVLVPALLLVALGSSPIDAQSSRSTGLTTTKLRDNPYRNAGGSCVYDRMGKLVHAPKGVDCVDGNEAPASASEEHEHSDSNLYDRHPLTEAQREVQELLQHHSQIAQELRMLRESIESKKRKASLARLDKITDELAMHLVREEALLKKVK